MKTYSQNLPKKKFVQISKIHREAPKAIISITTLIQTNRKTRPFRRRYKVQFCRLSRQVSLLLRITDQLKRWKKLRSALQTTFKIKIKKIFRTKVQMKYPSLIILSEKESICKKVKSQHLSAVTKWI